MPRVEIEIEKQLLDELSEAFFWEEQRSALYFDELSEAPSERKSPSPFVVARVDGLSIKIWADEHPPPHFHVTYQGEDASFSILDCRRLRGQGGLKHYDATIRSWWSKNQKRLIEEWNASRPTECPVGPINLPPAQA